MPGFPYGQQVVAGTNGVAGDHNNARKDGLTRWLKFEVLGPLVVGNTQGGSYLMPFAGTVVNTNVITDSGSCTVRITNITTSTTIDSGITASSSASTDSSPTNPSFAKNDVLSMDITAISSGNHLVVMLEVLPTP